MDPPGEIRTARMRLVPATAPMVRAELADHAYLAEALGADVPENWPPEQVVDAIDWFAGRLEADPSLIGWLGWYGVVETDEAPFLAAGGGFLGFPVEGAVEVGYSVIPQHQRNGYGKEMVGALVEWALSQPTVELVYAEVDSINTPSLRLLRAIGFLECGAGRDPGHLRFERHKTGQRKR